MEAVLRLWIRGAALATKMLSSTWNNCAPPHELSRYIPWWPVRRKSIKPRTTTVSQNTWNSTLLYAVYTIIHATTSLKRTSHSFQPTNYVQHPRLRQYQIVQRAIVDALQPQRSSTGPLRAELLILCIDCPALFIACITPCTNHALRSFVFRRVISTHIIKQGCSFHSLPRN